MKTKEVNSIFAIVAVVVFIVSISIPSYAVTSNGIVFWDEISPPNKILTTYDTGIVSNPNNIPIYACCTIYGNGDNAGGVCYATKTKPNSNVVLKNVDSEEFEVTPNDWIPIVINNEIYCYANISHTIGAFSQNRFKYTPAYYYPRTGNYPGGNGAYLTNNTYYPMSVTFAAYVRDNPDPVIQTPSTLNYSLPAGNIAIIETDSSYSYVNLTTTMPLQSTSFASNPWPNTTQRIGYYNTLPQTLNPNTMGNVIEWERNGKTTLFNVTTSAKYNPNVVSTFKYVVIANPYYYPANDMEDSQYTNGEINISMDGVINITVKSLTATVNTQTGVVEDNYNGTEWTGEIDDTTNDIIWTDGNGENNAPTSGGNLNDPSISGFQSWLKGLLNNIVNIFQPAHDAINTLSGAVSNFASWMYALYVWLPSPILSLLTSAISLAIVIGIIKVFI